LRVLCGAAPAWVLPTPLISEFCLEEAYNAFWEDSKKV